MSDSEKYRRHSKVIIRKTEKGIFKRNIRQREISILKEFIIHTNIVKYIDSSIQRLLPQSQSNIQKKHLSDDDDEDDDDNEQDSIYEISQLEILLDNKKEYEATINLLNDDLYSQFNEFIEYFNNNINKMEQKKKWDFHYILWLLFIK